MPRADARRSPSPRAGLTLIEIMVVIAIIVGVLGIAMPSMALLLDLQQRRAVTRLAEAFAYLRDEAVIRNVTFRIAFDVDAGAWQVQAGSPDAVIFDNPQEREDWERELRRRLERFTRRELEEGAADELLDEAGRFEKLTDVRLDTEEELPGGTRFAWVFTPEYAAPVEPLPEPPDDPEEDQVVYSYIFPDGQMEFTALRVVGEDDPEDGYTLIVEPLTGRIHVETEDVDLDELFSWLPDSAPPLP